MVHLSASMPNMGSRKITASMPNKQNAGDFGDARQIQQRYVQQRFLLRQGLCQLRGASPKSLILGIRKKCMLMEK